MWFQPCLITLIADEAVTTQLWRWSHSDDIFPHFNNCNENTNGCAADLSIRVRYVIQYMYYISLRDLRDSSHSSSFDMMLICICSEKCYDVLKILYFRSESFIIQRHVDKLASKYVRGCRHKSCRRTLRCPLHVFADHVSLLWEAFAVQVSPMSPSIHCIMISYGLLSALGGSFVVCFVDGRWLLHLGVLGTILIVLGGFFSSWHWCRVMGVILQCSTPNASIQLNNAHGSGYCFHKHTVFGCFVLPYRIYSHLYRCVISWCHSFPEDRGVRLCRWFVDINNKTCFGNADM